jgi:hypothetical protein
MDLQEYIRNALSGRRVVLVGNAPFREDRAGFVDAYDVVVRFNLFKTEWFVAGRCGSKLDYWCVNLVTGRSSPERRSQQDSHCEFVKSQYPHSIIVTPHEEDKHCRLMDAKKYYSQRLGRDLLYPDSGLDTGLKKQPSTGFYIAFRLVREKIPFSVIGFTGKTSKWHDGSAEVAILREDGLVAFHETP